LAKLIQTWPSYLKKPDTPRILKRKEVERLTTLAGSTIYLRISQGTFPKPIRLGSKRAVGWIETEVLEWINKRIIAREIDG